MARTYRDSLKVELREWRTFGDTLPVGAYPDQFRSLDVRSFQALKGGNMVMAPSRCGVWNDDRADSSAGRDRQRRLHKRRERSSWFGFELIAEGGA